ncbi:phage tail protein [Chryseobacterium sp. POE27]|uniref:phage tail protein n=1 Tax=Chryseobacterium sp. POE27 TaxID=3138177 RepID=UPI00321B3A8A
MKQLITTAVLLFSMTAFAQVGINNTSPKATLDITAKTNGTKPEGLIIPQLSGSDIRTATAAGVYGTNQKGLIVYASAADSAPAGATANITAPGYYYFDGSIWQRILGSSSGDTTNDSWTNDTANTMVKIGTKADGTARATGTDFIVKDNGYVGIGTTSPKAPLHLSYNNAASAITTSYLTPGLVLTGPSTGSGPGIYFEAQDNNTGNRIMKMHLSKDGSGDGYLNFESVTDNASGVVKKIMALSNNGNVNIDNTFYVDAASSKVGIGTSTPKSYLHVSSPAGQTTPIAAFSIVNCGSGCSQGTAKNIVLNNIHTNNSLFGSIDFVPGTDPLGDSGASIQGIDRDATNNYAGLSFFTRNATDYDSRMVIKSSGNVGIGTAAPNTNAALDISSTTKGVKLPSLALTATNNASPLSAHVAGMLVYNTATAGTAPNNVVPGLYTNDGTQWILLQTPQTVNVSAPAGTVSYTAASTVPAGYLECNGAAVSRTGYATLFAAIGTTYGAGDGSTTFNLPDLRGEFIRGWDHGRGVDTSRSLGSAQSNSTKLPNTNFTGTTSSYTHNHGVGNGTSSTNTVNAGSYGLIRRSASGENVTAPNADTGYSGTEPDLTKSPLVIPNDSHSHTVNVDGGGDTETRPRNIALMPIIKF